MRHLTLARTESADPIALDAVVEQLRLRGYEACVEADEPPPGDAPNAQLIVRFLSDEDGAGLARAGKHIWLAVRDATGAFPERVALYDHTGRLLNDTDAGIK
jgi:hypothetical protein